MSCIDCHRASIGPGYPLHCPTCLWCGARLIQRLGKMPIPAADSIAMRRKVLADWVAMGHSEQELRRLAKGPTPLAPTGQDAPAASERPKPVKRR
jgi:hypothetical protein